MKKQFKTEAAFKSWFVDVLRGDGGTPFCIETEETEPGFPDVLEIKGGKAVLYEMKLANKKGIFKMQKTQPLFYKKHQNLQIYVVVWDNAMSNYISIPGKLLANRCAEQNTLKLDIREFLYKAAFAEGEVRTGRKA